MFSFYCFSYFFGKRFQILFFGLVIHFFFDFGFWWSVRNGFIFYILFWFYMRFYSFFISVSPLFFIPQFIWSLTNLIFIYVGIHSIDLSGLFYSCFCFCFCCSWSCSCSCYCSSLSVVRYWLFVPAKRVRLWNMHTIHIILHIYIWYKLRYYLFTHL